eukprot:jgi/Bigna1/89343/estExt_fgenesh1_pg.C_470113
MMEIDGVGEVSHAASGRTYVIDGSESNSRRSFPRKLRDRSTDSLRSCPENGMATEQDLRRKAMAQTTGRRNSWPSPPELMLLSEVADKYRKLEEDTFANGGRRGVAVVVQNSTYYPHKSPRVPLRRHSFNSPQISSMEFRESALIRLHQAERIRQKAKSNSLPDRKQFQSAQNSLTHSVRGGRFDLRNTSFHKIDEYPDGPQDDKRLLRRASLPSSLQRKTTTMRQASSHFPPRDGIDAIQSSREREILMKKQILMREMRKEHLCQKIQQLKILQRRQIYHDKLRMAQNGNLKGATSINNHESITIKYQLNPNIEFSGNEDTTHCFQRAQIGDRLCTRKELSEGETSKERQNLKPEKQDEGHFESQNVLQLFWNMVTKFNKLYEKQARLTGMSKENQDVKTKKQMKEIHEALSAVRLWGEARKEINSAAMHYFESRNEL